MDVTAIQHKTTILKQVRWKLDFFLEKSVPDGVKSSVHISISLLAMAGTESGFLVKDPDNAPM